MKRTVIFDIATGPGIPMTGSLYLRPTNRMVADQVVNLPHPEAVIINGGTGTAELEVTPADEAWVWEAFESAGRTGVPNRRFLVPEGDGVLSYSETPYADPPPASPEWGPTAERARAFAEQAADSAGAAASSADAVAESIDNAQELVDSIGGLTGIEEQVGRAEAAASNADSQADRASTEADRAVAAADSIDTEALEEQIGAKIGRTDVADGTLFQRSGASTVGATVSSGTAGDSIARRTSTGALAVGAPTADTHAISRGFFYDILGFVDVRWFGAVGNSAADDTSALQAAINSGKPLYWGNRSYRITSGLSRTLSEDLAWRSDGARIFLDRASSIQYGVNISTAGFNVLITGRLTLDCQLNSFSGWYFNNTTSTFGDFHASGLGARNCYRKDQSFTSGDGIWVRGAWTNVFLERPDVRNIRMAAGAGVFGSQGISGITVSRGTSTGMAPLEITVLHPYVNGVVSEDTNYGADQDGIRIFGDYDNGTNHRSDTHFNISGGAFVNCRGRAVKVQAEAGNLCGVSIIRDSTMEPLIAGSGTMPEINYQVGGGIIRDLDIRYRGGSPTRLITWNGVPAVGGKTTSGISVSGIKLSCVAGGAVESILACIGGEQLTGKIRLSDVEVLGQAPTGHFLTVSGLSTATFSVYLDNIMSGLTRTNAFVHRAGSPTVFAQANNIYSPGTGNAVAFSTSGAATGYTTLLTGLNRGVA